MIEESMIFAAGLGKRMLPLTRKLPKPLIKINNTSILKNNIEKLLKCDFSNIVINTYYLPKKIINEVKEYDDRVKVVVEKERLETGGGLLNAIKKKSFNTNSPLLLLNGDIFWENKVYNSLDKIRKLWDPGKMDILLCLKKKRDFFGYYGSGEFQMKKSTKKASALYVEKNCSYAFTGLQVVKQEIITKKRKKIFSLREQIFDSLDKKKLFGYLDENPWFHIGTKDDLIRFREKLK
tara:strand:- start:843 stop:1550 length:708 start_codon:yes stop_codon:yes gene_type:complete